MNFKNFPNIILIKAFCFIFIILLFSQCKKDQILEDHLNSSNRNSFKISDFPLENLLASTIVPANAYNIENALPTGFVRDGSIDYTPYIQQAIDQYSIISFPGFPILINDTGLKIGSNKALYFLNGSEIHLKPTTNSNYNILDIRGEENVILADPVIIGDRHEHLGTEGEAGIGIGIRGSNNITLINPKVSNCWGDGIYIGVNDNLGSKNITIKGGFTSNNRRDGLTIISVDGFKLDNFYSGYNFGTTPECGINFEPNSNTNELKNIVFNNITTEGNLGYGIMMGFSNLYGGTNKNIDITINNHIDNQSKKAIKISCYPTRRLGNEVITSNVVYNNPSWKQNTLTKDIISVALFDSSQKLTINKPALQTASGEDLNQLEIVSKLSRLFNKGSNSVLTFLSGLPLKQEPVLPVSLTSVIFAINAGGEEFTASSGIKYLTDRNFTGGSIYKTTAPISNTEDDALYQSERYGNFSYDIPVSDGTYEVTIKLAELYQSTIGHRSFNIRLEAADQISNLDIFAVAAKYNAYDVVKTIKVTDGKLNIQFNTNIDNAKVSALHVIRK